jgi:hypothetical protein
VPITTDLAKWITTPHRIPRCDGASMPTDSELIPQIPKAVRRDLRFQGVLNLALLGLSIFALQLVAKVAFNRDATASLGGIDLFFAAIAGGCCMLVFGGEAMRWPIRRQLFYRRLHGKWRWER